MFVFYDRPFPHIFVYFAKNVAYFPFNSWLSFQGLCRLLWGYYFLHGRRKEQAVYSLKYYIVHRRKSPARNQFHKAVYCVT